MLRVKVALCPIPKASGFHTQALFSLFFLFFFFFFLPPFYSFLPSITYIGKHSLLKRCQIRFLLFLFMTWIFFSSLSDSIKNLFICRPVRPFYFPSCSHFKTTQTSTFSASPTLSPVLLWIRLRIFSGGLQKNETFFVVIKFFFLKQVNRTRCFTRGLKFKM